MSYTFKVSFDTTLVRVGALVGTRCCSTIIQVLYTPLAIALTGPALTRSPSKTNPPGITLSSDAAHYTGSHILEVQPTIVLHQLSATLRAEARESEESDMSCPEEEEGILRMSLM